MISFDNTSFPRFERIKHKLGNFEGISEKELTEIESEFQVKLPKAYRDFMRIFGKQPGCVLAGYFAQYPSVLENRGAVEFVLDNNRDIPEEDKPVFKPSYFFFAQWQGYSYWFFDCDENVEDPKVFLFQDNGKCIPTLMTFTEFVYYEGLAGMGIALPGE